MNSLKLHIYGDFNNMIYVSKCNHFNLSESLNAFANILKHVSG